MGEEDRVELGQADRAQQLALRALAAVEQQPSPAGAQQERRQPAARGGHRAGRAGEEQREVHRRLLEVSRQRYQLEGHATAASAVATPMVWRGDRRRSVGEPGLKIAKPPRSSCSGMCEWPNTTASTSGKRRAQALEPAVGEPAVVDHRDPRAVGVDDPDGRQPGPQLGRVDVAVDRVDGRPERLELGEHGRLDEVAGVEDGVRGLQALDAGGAGSRARRAAGGCH